MHRNIIAKPSVLTFATSALFALSTPVMAAMPASDAPGQPYAGVDFGALTDPANGVYYGVFDHVISYTDIGYTYVDPQYEGIETPVLWRTMGEDTSVNPEGDGSLTLFSLYVLDVQQWTKMGSGFLGDDGDPNAWKTSTVAAWLNNTQFTALTSIGRPILDAVPEDFTNTGFLNNFSEAELGQLRTSQVTTSKYAGTFGWVGAIPNYPAVLLRNSTLDSTDLVYLPWVTPDGAENTGTYPQYRNSVWLSARDAKDNIFPAGRLSDPAEKIGTLKNGTPTTWWSRTPSIAFGSWVSYVDYNGSIVNDGSGNHNPGQNATHGVRPVAKLDPESIILAEPITPASANEYYTVSTTGANYKLTVVSDELDLTAQVCGNGPSVTAGKPVSINGSASAGADSVHYKIVLGNQILAHGLAADTSTTSLVIPTVGLAPGSYELYVWAQKGNEISSNEGSIPLFFPLTLKNDAWLPERIYDTGDQVSYAGKLWQASWWTQNQKPGDPYGPWQEIAVAADCSAIWTASRIFTSGDVVVYAGKKYVAQWWTRNQTPGDPYGPWRRLP